ncbi:unnamed protein product [Paramecium octaurelia]|uniref:Uncharacterized protein n=1 Tax=Paramecium octaurelia TaxID=43137 RepID=A0A8S1V6A0_PAROT|nr:unnamed protein product [Paramecium octaurelia]
MAFQQFTYKPLYFPYLLPLNLEFKNQKTDIKRWHNYKRRFIRHIHQINKELWTIITPLKSYLKTDQRSFNARQEVLEEYNPQQVEMMIHR